MLVDVEKPIVLDFDDPEAGVEAELDLLGGLRGLERRKGSEVVARLLGVPACGFWGACMWVRKALFEQTSGL